MDREGALKYIKQRYPDQKEIWSDYLDGHYVKEKKKNKTTTMVQQLNKARV